MSLSTHVLDSSRGRPASGVRVRLDRRDGGTWAQVSEGVTDDDGRIREVAPLAEGVHRLVFETAGYSDFYPEVVITFAVGDPTDHYHVPLLLSPFAYSTYRGS
jgi:5-hydroxyisourate hydrolase